jgi:hypothetical protein
MDIILYGEVEEMRLIDADSLVEEMEKWTNNLARLSEILILKNIISYIDKLPIAYDVDEVIEQLRQQADQYHDRAESYFRKCMFNESSCMGEKAASYNDAIEIVKTGGIENG